MYLQLAELAIDAGKGSATMATALSKVRLPRTSHSRCVLTISPLAGWWRVSLRFCFERLLPRFHPAHRLCRVRRSFAPYETQLTDSNVQLPLHSSRRRPYSLLAQEEDRVKIYLK